LGRESRNISSPLVTTGGKKRTPSRRARGKNERKKGGSSTTAFQTKERLSEEEKKGRGRDTSFDNDYPTTRGKRGEGGRRENAARAPTQPVFFL